MVSPGRKVATYADVLAAPEHMVAELMAGELHLQPRPAAPHAVAGSTLSMILGPPYHRGRGGPGGWLLLFEPELHLREDVLVPDMAGWLRSSAVGGELEAAYFTTPPRWVLEVLSPSTARHDRVLKLPRYHAAGVEYAWLLDPEARTLEVLRRQDDGWLLTAGYAGAAVIRAAPFGGVEIELSELWVGADDESSPAPG